MAYKFQVGSFTASGSIKAESGFDAGDSNVANVGDIDADSISVADAANGLNIDGSGANNDTFKITMADNQAAALNVLEGSNSYLKFVTTNSSEAIVASQKLRIADDTKLTFGAGDDASFEYDEDGNDVLLYAGASIRISDDTKLEFGSGGDCSFEYDEDGNDVLLYAGNAIRMPDDTKLEFGAAGDAGIEYDEDGDDTLRIHAPAAGVTIAGTTPTITIGDNGDEDVKLVFDQSGQDFYVGVDATDDDLKIGLGNAVGTNTAITLNGDANVTMAGNLTVNGDLTIEGTTTTVNSTTIAITSSFTFEGPSPNAHETVFGVTDPTADATINLPAMSAGTYHVPVLAAASTTAISSTPGELNLLDGSGKSTSSITVADADAIIIIDGNTTKQIPASDLKTYIGAGTLSVSSGSSGGVSTIAVGVNYYNTLGAATNATLTTGSSLTVGDVMYIKAGPDCSSTNTLTVAAAGSDTIDGTEDHFVLESPNAAVTLIYVAQGDFRIF